MILFIEKIQTFVKLQQALWTLLLTSISDDPGEFLANVPKNGEIILNGKIWKYKKHGLGVCFIEENTKTKIDFHRADSGAECFDAWGLSLFFGSLGNKGQKILNEYGMASESYTNRINFLLIDLEESGEIIQKGEAYEIRDKE